jgi:hypothetical protein
MGGNTTYNKALGGIPMADRTHFENGNRIDGHKVIIQKVCPSQVKVPMNSNSESPIYLCAVQHIDKNSKNIWYEIKSIGIYKDHKCVGQIDLKFDKNNNVLPFSNNDGGSHYHNFHIIDGNGSMGRKSHDSNNHNPIPEKYWELVKKIEDYNKKQKL